MSKAAFEKIKAGLESAKAYLDGTADKRKYRVHVPDEDRMYEKFAAGLACPQEAFAQKYGFALSAVRRLGARPPYAGAQRSHPAQDRR